VKIRAAAPADTEAIGRVHVETWRSAYRGLVSDAYLAGLSPAKGAARWRTFLADRDPARVLLVAEDDVDGVIGFAAAGPERSGDATYRGEIYGIYVTPSQQRRGCGRHLIGAATRRLAAVGFPSMLLWVLEANAPARAFYEALGGIVLRRQPIEIGGAPLTEVAYGWSDLTVL
jgi:ribosomal protein S18 acetylase RimI-like enzyme